MNSYSSEILLYSFQELFFRKFNKNIEKITPVSPGASARKIFRLESGDSKAIGIFNEGTNENIAFIEFAKTFRENGINAPEIYCVSDDKRFYIEQNLGSTTLNDVLQTSNADLQITLSIHALKELHRIQTMLKEKIDYSLCYQTNVFNEEVIESDISKFGNYYPKLGKRITIEPEKLLLLFNTTIDKLNNEYFLYRDFQSRNIMIYNNDYYFIDFQSGRKGPLYYDAASFIFSGSYYFEDEVKDKLIEEYKNIVRDEILHDNFINIFHTLALLRLVQMLGSYSYTFIELQKDWVLPKFETVYKNIEYIKSRSSTDEIIELCEKLLLNKKS